MHVLFEAVLQRRNLSKVRICSCFFDRKLQFKVVFKIAFRKFLLQAFCKWLTFYDCLNLPLLPFAYVFPWNESTIVCCEKTTLYASCMLLSSDCLGLRNLYSLIDLSDLCNLAGLNSLYSLFFQKTSWSWLFDHPCHQNDQHRSLVVDWILKNPIFHWYLVPFLSEAVEASLCYFFENWLMKIKCPNLRNKLISSL